MASARVIFITGGTGYVGRPLIRALLNRGHIVRALVRAGSEKKLPLGCEAVIGNALDRRTFAGKIAPATTFVQLVGVPHPGPGKGPQFRAIDLVSVQQSVAAAVPAGIQHFVYLSVAHPAPAMGEYIAVRIKGEELVRESGLNATIVQPWYVLGPSHWWPYAFVPIYWICERLPATREGAQRLGLVKLSQMVDLLVKGIEEPAQGVRVLGVPQIKAGKL